MMDNDELSLIVKEATKVSAMKPLCKNTVNEMLCDIQSVIEEGVTVKARHFHPDDEFTYLSSSYFGQIRIEWIGESGKRQEVNINLGTELAVEGAKKAGFI